MPIFIIFFLCGNIGFFIFNCFIIQYPDLYIEKDCNMHTKRFLINLKLVGMTCKKESGRRKLQRERQTLDIGFNVKRSFTRNLSQKKQKNGKRRKKRNLDEVLQHMKACAHSMTRAVLSFGFCPLPPINATLLFIKKKCMKALKYEILSLYWANKFIIICCWVLLILLGLGLFNQKLQNL